MAVITHPSNIPSVPDPWRQERHVDQELCHNTEAGGINAVRAKRRNKLLPVVERFHGGGPWYVREGEESVHGDEAKAVAEAGRRLEGVIPHTGRQREQQGEIRETLEERAGEGGLGKVPGEEHICSHSRPAEALARL